MSCDAVRGEQLGAIMRRSVMTVTAARTIELQRVPTTTQGSPQTQPKPAIDHQKSCSPK